MVHNKRDNWDDPMTARPYFVRPEGSDVYYGEQGERVLTTDSAEIVIDKLNDIVHELKRELERAERKLAALT